MGKSNKFDYTNRANSGPKLGHIIGAALQKEAEKVKKDAEKQAQKPPRKQSIPSSSALADHGTATHTIDLRAPGKNLTDEGVCELADGLKLALESGTSQASLALEDLNLSGNLMTTASLEKLSPIIQQSSEILKTVNLADNKIRVESDEEAARWEGFLRAFKDCKKLRRLDLSGNVELGARAMEILARVHEREERLDPITPGGETSAEDSESGYNSSMANSRSFSVRCGLRSISHIILNNIALEDAGALWLSYLLENHHYPSQLIDDLIATHSDKTNQQDANSNGVEWNENDTLGKDGRQLLEKTESIRRQSLLENQGSSAARDAYSVIDTDRHDRRKSAEQRALKARQEARRVSVKSLGSMDGGDHEAGAVESTRKRITRQIIVHSGTSSVELWKAALVFLRVSRLLERASPLHHQYDTHDLRFAELFDDPVDSPSTLSPTQADSQVIEELENLTINVDPADTDEATKSTSRATELVVDTEATLGEPEHVLTDVTNTPKTPLLAQKPTQRKDAFSEGADLDNANRQLNRLATREAGRRFIEYQQKRIAEKENQNLTFRDRNIPCHLPRDVIERIVGEFLSEREMNALSVRQREAVVEWGQRRATMEVEREWHKKDQSVQVLMLLDCLGCLAHRR